MSKDEDNQKLFKEAQETLFMGFCSDPEIYNRMIASTKQSVKTEFPEITVSDAAADNIIRYALSSSTAADKAVQDRSNK